MGAAYSGERLAVTAGRGQAAGSAASAPVPRTSCVRFLRTQRARQPPVCRSAVQLRAGVMRGAGRRADELQRAQEGPRACVRECVRASRPAPRVAARACVPPGRGRDRRRDDTTKPNFDL